MGEAHRCFCRKAAKLSSATSSWKNNGNKSSSSQVRWGEPGAPSASLRSRFGREYPHLMQGRRVDARGIVVKERVRKLKGLLLGDLAIEDHPR